MIVIGVGVHKHSLSAVAVDEVGRQLDCLEASDGEELLAWSKRVGRRCLWALEDCRHVTRGLERLLQRQRQRLVRVPPRLTAPERRRGRVRGKSDLIDALAIARAALREPLLDSPRPEEARLRELKLLVDTATISSTNDVELNSGCAGTCTSSTRPSRSRSARSIAASGCSGGVVSSVGGSRPGRRGSHVSCSAVAAASRARSASSTANSRRRPRRLHPACSRCPAVLR